MAHTNRNTALQAIKETAEDGRVSQVAELLEDYVQRWGIDFDDTLSDCDRLMLGSTTGDSAHVSELLELNECESFWVGGVTPLMIASYFGHTPVTELFLSRDVPDQVSVHFPQPLNDHNSELEGSPTADQHKRGGSIVNLSTKTGANALIVACQEGHVDIVETLLHHGAIVNSTDEDGDSALTTASVGGFFDIVKILLEHGADVNATDEKGWTSLIIACERGFDDIATLLLDHGAAVDSATHVDGATALLQAAKVGNLSCAKILLEFGAFVDARDYEGATSLFQATHFGNSDICNLLLDEGALGNLAKFDGSTPLTRACWQGHLDILEMLLESGAKVNDVDCDGNSGLIMASFTGCVDAVALLLKHGADIELTDNEGYSSIISASQNGHTDVVRMLLENGAKVNQTTHEEKSALIQACWNGHCGVIELLLDHGANINITDHTTATGLIRASQHGHAGAVQLLLERGADVNAQDDIGRTALFLACSLGHTQVVNVLLQCGADTDIGETEGETSLIVACAHGHIDAVQLLVNHGADINCANQRGLTPLMAACEHGGDADIVNILLDKKAKVNVAKESGRTALMQSCWKGCHSTVKVLLDCGADVNASDNDGATSLVIASQQGYTNVVQLLIDNKAQVNPETGHGPIPLLQASSNGHEDTVKLLIQYGADINFVDHRDISCLIAASVGGHSSVVKLLLQCGADVNAADSMGMNSLITASDEGHADVVKLLVQNGARVNDTTNTGETAVIAASRKNHWKVVEELINAGSNLIHRDYLGENALMYIAHGLICNEWKSDVNLIDQILQTLPKKSQKNLLQQQSDYAISLLSAMLIRVLTHGTYGYCTQNLLLTASDNLSKSTLGMWLYGFLPESFVQGVKSGTPSFSPWKGVESRVSLHTVGTALLLTPEDPSFPNIFPSEITPSDFLNMLGQTPLHLIAMEPELQESELDGKVDFLMNMGFRFSDRDHNGRLPLHMACMCGNHTFVLSEKKHNGRFTESLVARDNMNFTPKDYLLGAPRLDDYKENLKIMIATGDPCKDQFTEIHVDTVRNYRKEKNTSLLSLEEAFTRDMGLSDLSAVTESLNNTLVEDKTIQQLFLHISKGVARLDEQPYQHDVVSVLDLLLVIGFEMGKIDPLFQCEPYLKGSVQEFTKCGHLDEIDTAMKLVNFPRFFEVVLSRKAGDPIKLAAGITQFLEKRYWRLGKDEEEQFAVVEFCADFWNVFLRALQSETVREALLAAGIAVENCQRKHGFVGMLQFTCWSEDYTSTRQLTADIAPCIENSSLEDYIALLGARHFEGKQIGDRFHKGFELSSSRKDWNVLKYAPPEVLGGYTLIKLLRSHTQSFTAESGIKAYYTAEEILPSYMLKMGLLWVLDTDDKFDDTYNDQGWDCEKVEIFRNEPVLSYTEDVFQLCDNLTSKILEDAKGRGEDTLEALLSNLALQELSDIRSKCAKNYGYLAGAERIRPYVLMTIQNSVCGRVQNGVNLEQARRDAWEVWSERLLPMLLNGSEDQVIYNRAIYSHPKYESGTAAFTKGSDIDENSLDSRIAPSRCSEEMARKCRIWALRIVRLLPHLLQHSKGVRNYFLPGQQIHSPENDLAIGLCRAFEAYLQ